MGRAEHVRGGDAYGVCLLRSELGPDQDVPRCFRSVVRYVVQLPSVYRWSWLIFLHRSDLTRAATTNTALFGLNQAFLIMFSLSVTLVSITNQKEYGNIGFGLSLIGPRMSSVGVGWMLLQ